MSAAPAAAAAAPQKPLVKYVQLGKAGVRVSNLCLGAMTLGSQEKNNWGLPTAALEESFNLLDAFVAAGGNFIDTANVYGDSEKVIGDWLQARGPQMREKLIIATKVGIMIGADTNQSGLSRKHILASVEQSLTRLQSGFIDLFQVHAYDPYTSLEETWSTLNDLVREGKVRYLGVSNYSGWQLQKTLDLCRTRGWEAPVCLQPQYSLLCRSTEWELLELAKEEGLAVIPWSPLAGGWLSGRYKKEDGKPASGSRVAWADAVSWKATDWKTISSEERTWEVLDVLHKLAAETGRTVAQIAIRWVMQKDGITAPILGVKNMTQLQDNLQVLSFSLTAEQMKALDDVSAVAAPYPYSIIRKRA